MNFFPNAKESSAAREAPDRYAAYMGEYQELFQRYGVGFGRAQDFVQLAPKLGQDAEFRIDFGALTKRVRDREEGHLTLTQILTIVAVAIGGPEVLNTRGLNTVPVVVALKGIGEWNGMGGDTETIVKSARSRNSSRPADETVTGERRAEDEKEAIENRRLSAELVEPPAISPSVKARRGGFAPPMRTDPTPPRDAFSQLEWALKMGPEGSDEENEVEPSVEPVKLQSGEQAGTQAGGNKPDEFRAALDHGWFSVDSRGGPQEEPQQDPVDSGPRITSGPLAADVMSRLERALKMGAESLDIGSGQMVAPLAEQRSSSTEAGPTQPPVDEPIARMNSKTDVKVPRSAEIERADARISQPPFPKSGEIASVAPAVPQISRDEVVKLPDRTVKDVNTSGSIPHAAGPNGLEAGESTAGEKHDSKETKAAAMAALNEVLDLATSSKAGKLGLVAAVGIAVLLPVMVIGVMIHRDQMKVAETEPPEDVPVAATVTAEADGGKDVEGGVRRNRSAGAVVEPRTASRAGRTQAGRRARPGGAAGDWMTITGGVEEPQIALDQTAPIPVMANSPAKIHTGQTEAAPSIAATGQAGMPDIDVGPVSWLANLKGNEKIQVTVHQTEPVPVENAPAKIHYGQVDAPPSIAGGEMAKGTPAVVANAKAPPPPPVTMARVEGAPGVGAAGSGTVDMAAVTGGGAPSGGASGVVNGNGKKSKKKKVTVHSTVGVSTGLLGNYLVKYSVPSYPRAAKKQKLEGDVLVRVLISEKGKIEKAIALNGPPQLRSAVEKTVRKWRYKPYILNGRPVEVQTWVTFHFTLTES